MTLPETVSTPTGEHWRQAGLYALQARKAQAERIKERRKLTDVERAELSRINEALYDLQRMGPGEPVTP